MPSSSCGLLSKACGAGASAGNARDMMFIRGAVTVALSLTAVSLPILLAAPAWSEQSLSNLECIKIQVSLVETGEPLGTSKEEIRDALAVGVRAKLPRLLVDPTCTNALNSVIFIDIFPDNTRIDAFSAVNQLELLRKATVVETGRPGLAREWAKYKLLRGPKNIASSGILDDLDTLLTQFAADYHEAGNQ